MQRSAQLSDKLLSLVGQDTGGEFSEKLGNLVLIAKGLLSRMGHSVAGFTDPEAALDHFGRHPDAFDVVVTDLSMPTLSGMEFARAVLAVRPEVPIVMTSGWLRSEDETAAHDIGIRELMLKPLSMHDLNHVIDRVARIRVS